MVVEFVITRRSYDRGCNNSGYKIKNERAYKDGDHEKGGDELDCSKECFMEGKNEK